MLLFLSASSTLLNNMVPSGEVISPFQAGGQEGHKSTPPQFEKLYSCLHGLVWSFKLCDHVYTDFSVNAARQVIDQIYFNLL